MNLDAKHKTIKPLGKIIGENLQDIGVGREFLYLTTRTQSIKEATI